jgi:hypothetical protein
MDSADPAETGDPDDHGEIICAHCRRPQQGLAGVSLSGIYYPLCHPDEGLDCYRLVTVYRHALNQCRRCV